MTADAAGHEADTLHPWQGLISVSEASLERVRTRLYRAACKEPAQSAAPSTWLWATDDTVMWGSDEDERAHGPEEVKALLEAVVASPSELGFDWEEREQHVEGDVCSDQRARHVLRQRRGDAVRVTAVLVPPRRRVALAHAQRLRTELEA